MKLKIRILSLLLAVITLLGVFTGCGVIKGETVMSYGNYKITEAMYSYWIARYKTLFLYAYNNSKDTNTFWDTEIREGYNYEQFILEYINEYAAKVLISMKLFDDLSLAFTDTVKNEVKTHIEDLIAAYGTRGELEAVLGEYGLNIKTLETIYYAENKLTAVNEYLFGDGGDYAVSDNDRDEYYNENYYCAEWIYIYTKAVPKRDEQGGYITDTSGVYVMEELSEERKAEQAAKVAEVTSKLDAGITSFIALKNAYSEEDLENYTLLPDGVNISANDFENYGTDFIKVLQGLEIGEYGLLEDEYATFIIHRRELKDFAQLTDTELSVMGNFETYVFDKKVEDFYSQYEVEYNNDVMSSFNIRELQGLKNTNI